LEQKRKRAKYQASKKNQIKGKPKPNKANSKF
jgi:hypothetical protein